MRVICLTVNATSVVAGANLCIHMDVAKIHTWSLAIVVGFFAVYPIDQVRRLYLLLRDKRPRPRVWPTAVLADPQDGYPEEVDWRLIGTVTERL